MFERICLPIVLLAGTHFALAQAPEAPGKPLPPGPMQAKVKAACTQCHNASRITEQHFSRTKWSDELDKMAGLGASVPRLRAQRLARLSDQEFRSAKGRTQSGAQKRGPKLGSYVTSLFVAKT